MRCDLSKQRLHSRHPLSLPSVRPSSATKQQRRRCGGRGRWHNKVKTAATKCNDQATQHLIDSCVVSCGVRVTLATQR